VAPTERLAAVARLLTEEGYMAEASATTSSGTLVEHNCAVQAVASASGDLCAEAGSSPLSSCGGRAPVHILTGCSACEYRFGSSTPTAERPRLINGDV